MVGQVLDLGHLHVHTPPLLCPALSSRLLASMNCTQGFSCLLASTELTSRGSRRNAEWEERKKDSLLLGQSSAPLPKLLWESFLGSGNLFFLLPLQAQKWSWMLAQVFHLPLLVFCNPVFTFVNMFWHQVLLNDLFRPCPLFAARGLSGRDSNLRGGQGHGSLLQVSAKLKPKRQGQVSQAWEATSGGNIKYKTESELCTTPV